MDAFIQHIEIQLNEVITSYGSLRGGDINEAIRLDTKSNRYFLKWNSSIAYPSMLQLEADGLDALRDQSDLVVPMVINQGIAGKRQWLVLEWL